MDVRAFGSIYGQTSSLPFTSGFEWTPAQGRKNFPACRAIFIESNATPGTEYLSAQLSDAPGQTSTVDHLQGNILIPISCTALVSGSVHGVHVLY